MKEEEYDFESVEHLFARKLMIKQSKKIMKKTLSNKEADHILSTGMGFKLVKKIYKEIMERDKGKNANIKTKNL